MSSCNIAVDHAGVAILAFNADQTSYDVLCLDDRSGYLDLTKGAIEHSESPLDAALRECHEEAGIDDLVFTWGMMHIIVGGLIMYVAETSDTPVIRPNRLTGIVEHRCALWLPINVARCRVHGYLSPVIEWARRVIMGYVSM